MDDVQCYCIDEIAISINVLSDLCEKLPVARSSYDKKCGSAMESQAIIELQMLVRNLWDVLTDLIRLLNEYGDMKLAETTGKLLSATKSFNYLEAPNYNQLCGALKVFKRQLPQKDNINSAKLGRLMNRVKMGFFQTDLAHVNLIKQALVYPEGVTVNFLDPCCGTGHSLARLAAGENALTYGIEIDDERAEQAAGRLNRVGFGSFFFSHVSSNAFHCLFLNPPYMSAPSQNGNRRLEKAFLGDSFRHLMIGGLLFYIIPYYRATEDICRVLVENFEELQVYRFMHEEFSKFNQIIFIGRRCKRTERYEQITKLYETAMYPDRLPSLNELSEKSLVLPNTEKKVEQFKGDKFNTHELSEQLKHSHSIDKLFESSALDSRKRQPLLPLNLSQIGLVGASGLMNGLIECETPHVIKGRIVKEIKTTINDLGNGDTEIKEITSNKMIFNVLTPNGFMSLS